MSDFVDFCQKRGLIDIQEDGTVVWKEEDGGKKINHKEKISGARDARKDLSKDYKDPCAHMGKVWPFKVLSKKSK